MRYILSIFSIVIIFLACKKDKFTTVPQISFKSIKPNAFLSSTTDRTAAPILTITVTDAEGDLGFKTGKDTSVIYITNLLTNKLDSFNLPDIQTSAQKDFKADVEINLFAVMGGSNRPRPKTDTLFFEVYIKDFAKNKSNVIKTSNPVFYITP